MEQNQTNNQSVKEAITKEMKPVCKGCNTRNMIIGGLVIVLVAMLLLGAGRAMHIRDRRDGFSESRGQRGDRDGRGMMRDSFGGDAVQSDQFSSDTTAAPAPTVAPVPVKAN